MNEAQTHMASTLYIGINSLVTMNVPGASGEDRLGIINDGAMLVEGANIVCCGPRAVMEKKYPASARNNLSAPLVIPGLVECHSHLVFAGSRLDDFQARVQGQSYEERARSGGGILSTVRAVRNASEEELEASASKRLSEFARWGVTSIETKSGYGLDTANELKLLRVASRLAKSTPLAMKNTFLGAHATPMEFHGRVDDYIDYLIDDSLPAVQSESLAEFCDVFVEKGAFTPPQAQRLLQAAIERGLKPKVHAEQLSWSGGCLLAARMGALSADHLDWATPDDARAMAEAGVTPVLLPTATMFLGKTSFPNGKMFLEQGLEPAISTDFNPGTSPFMNLFLAGNLACVYCALRLDDALVGITLAAARASGFESSGRLAPGNRADFLVCDCPDWRELFYRPERNPVLDVFASGQSILKGLDPPKRDKGS